jgi:molybdopterin synthase catalytic subunit
MIEQWVAEVKNKSAPEGLGMILVHNGIVRGTSKQGRPVNGMNLCYKEIVSELERE